MLSIPYLACRSYFSLLQGALSPEDIVAYAEQGGIKALGMADLGNFYGLVRFRNAMSKAGLKALWVMDIPGPQLSDQALWLCVLDPEGYAFANRIATLYANGELDAADPRMAVLTMFITQGPHGGLALGIPPDLASPELGATCMKIPHVHVSLRWGWPQEDAKRGAVRTGLPLLALAGGTWITQEDQYRLSLLRAVDLRVSIGDTPVTSHPYEMLRMPSPGEVEGFFTAFPQAVDRARALVDLSPSRILPERFVFPAFESMSNDQAMERLKALCKDGLAKRYPGREGAALARLGHELAIIGDKGFTSYFLVVHNIVSQAPRTCGRGSAASSIVSYLLGITHVDPLCYNLFFERFLHRARKDPPDIDIDFPWDEREQVLSYVFSHYKGHAGMVADHVTFASRAALREGVLALGEGLEALAIYQRAWELSQYDEIPTQVWRAYKALKGVPRNIGTHPGGVVITPRPLEYYTHVQTSPLGWPVIAWEKDATEDAGLVKIDLLGNRSLAVLRDVLSATVGKDHVMDHWNDMKTIHDPLAREAINKGDTLGVFYVESPATRQLLGKMGSVDFEGLVAASSIIRPAANRFAKDFVARLRGAPWKPVHPRAGAILADTYGIMVYQEDVSRVAIACAGFSPEDADALRKVLTRKDRVATLRDFYDRFLSGATLLGLTKSQVDSLWDQMLSFDGYSFCKSHSASYALVSWQLAAIKVRHALEFFCAVINNGGGFYSKQVYLNQVRRLGYPIDLPSVVESEGPWTCTHGRLRVGLSQIKGLSQGTLHRIVQERSRQGFFSFRDFMTRVQPDVTELARLVKSGALDHFCREHGRPSLYWQALSKEKPGRGQGDLLDIELPALVKRDHPPMVKLKDEHESLDLWCSIHPLSLLGERAKQLAQGLGSGGGVLCTSQDLPSLVGKGILIPGSLVAGKEVLTKNVQTMGFLSFDDPMGIFETVVFPDAYKRILPILLDGTEFLVQGVVTVEWEVIIIELRNIFLLNRR